MVPAVDVKAMLEAGAHFGHQTRRWNPKMRPFIYSQRDGVHIIDLEQTAAQTERALQFIIDIVTQGQNILFVGTKKQARELIRQEAMRAGQFYAVNRWLGGTLTNFKTIKSSIDRLKALCAKRESGELDKLTKKEGLTIERTITKLESALGGIKDMTKMPGALFIIDPNQEEIAKKEALRLGVPIIAIIDTNGNPEGIDYPIVANDDAIRSIAYFTKLVADAAAEGVAKRDAWLKEQTARAEKDKAEGRGRGTVREEKVGGKGRAYTAKRPGEGEVELSADELAAFAKASVEAEKVDEGNDK